MLLRSNVVEQKELFDRKLLEFSNEEHSLGILNSIDVRATFILQLIDSVRRVDYIEMLLQRPVSSDRTEPLNSAFDPLRAAIYHYSNQNVDEACWLIFLFTHFGKNPDSGYRLCADIYGAYGERDNWTWSNIYGNSDSFYSWHLNCYPKLIADGNVRKFGNHRKYESIKPNANRSLTKVFDSYCNWVGPSHEQKFSELKYLAEQQEMHYFDYLYRSIKSVSSIGRTGAFDYLTMLSKIGIIDAAPEKLYLQGSTGPIKGARLLFGENYTLDWTTGDFEQKLSELGDFIGLGKYKMQVLEDALCNWQKSPDKYIYFRG